jgi:hypothetical protein
MAAMIVHSTASFRYQGKPKARDLAGPAPLSAVCFSIAEECNS